MKFGLITSAALIVTTVAAFGFAPRGPSASLEVAPVANIVTEHADQAFTVDGVHSSVMFRIEHMGVSNFYGAFKDVSGSYTLGDTPSFNITVKTDSVDTRNAGRDKHLTSPDFFNAIEFPALTFKSTKVEKTAEGMKVTGDLSLHGVTKSITIDMKVWDSKETRQGVKSGFETMFDIKRSDFGMNTYIAEGGLGDEVTVLVAIEGNAAKE